MAETKDPQKSLEMRVAELEDKLSQMHISEQDMQTYQRVAAKLGVSQAQPNPQAAISPIYNYCYYYHCYYFRCYYYNDCIIGPQGQGGPAGGGFGGFGR